MCTVPLMCQPSTLSPQPSAFHPQPSTLALVLCCQVKGHPWWPAVVGTWEEADRANIQGKGTGNTRVSIVFFGDYCGARLPSSGVLPFKLGLLYSKHAPAVGRRPGRWSLVVTPS